MQTTHAALVRMSILDSTAPYNPRQQSMHRRLDNKAGSGIHIGTSGVEFDERVVALGRNAEARFGATVGFPRQIPVMEGEQLFNWDIHRLGLKTRW